MNPIEIETNGWATSALHDAALNNSLDGVKQAITDGADVNDADPWGQSRTALMEAARFATDPEIIRMLIAAGADIRKENFAGACAFDYLKHNNALKDDKEIQDLLNPELHKKI